MPADLQTPRYDQIMRRVGGVIGPGSKVSEVLSELFPVFDVENMPAELLILGGWRLGFGSELMDATAANNGHIQLFNPVGSGKLTVLTQVMFSGNFSQEYRFDITATALTNATGNERVRDTRQSIIERPVAQVRNVFSTFTAGNSGRITALANITERLMDVNEVVVLGPGTGFTISTSVVNTDIRTSFFWRERIALQSELLFPSG